MRPAKPAPTMWTELALAPAVEAGAEEPEPDSEAAALEPVPEAEEPRLQCQNDLWTSGIVCGLTSRAGGVGSVAGTAGTSGSTGSRGNSLAGREVVGDAALDASRELVAVLLGAVTLVALLGALGGVDHIGSVGVSSAQAGSLAGSESC
jgi:hypothetical protein